MRVVGGESGDTKKKELYVDVYMCVNVVCRGKWVMEEAKESATKFYIKTAKTGS